MKLNSTYNKLKNFIFIFLIFGILASFMFITEVLINKFLGEKTTSADGFTIESYSLVLDVSKENSIDVTENITVNFYESGHHGIYRFIPTWLEYTSKDGNTQSRKAKISNLVAHGENYTVDTDNGKQRIKIGNENKTLTTGYHTYMISYTYDMGADPYDNFDEFIFHAFGDYWGTRINNASIEINLPSNFNVSENIHFFSDKYRKNDITSYVNYTVFGNTIYATLSSDYPLNSSLTIDLDLPDGYFSNTTNNYGSISLIFCIICIAFVVISFLLWRKNGKDLDKVLETVEFNPPEQLDASEIGYLYKKDTGKKLSIALVIELASKGFIKIIESEDKKTQTILKVDYADNNKKLSENEELVYNQLFEDSNETILSENHSFYKVFRKVSENLMNKFDDKINDLKSYKCMLISSLGFLICSILLGLAYCVIEDLNPKLSFIYLFAFISNVFTFIFSILMKRKNSYGEQMTAKINGFRRYIELAEKNQIDMLVEENPNYFYDILPYAYVLNVSKKWIEKFENIPVPSNDMGNFDYYNVDSLDTLSSSVYTPSGSSSGCSSCGGGCSSCGGGGSW